MNRNEFAGRYAKGEADLNIAQQEGLSYYLSKENRELHDNDPSTVEVTVKVEHGQVNLHGAFLHSDGEFATWPECGCEYCGSPEHRKPQCVKHAIPG